MGQGRDYKGNWSGLPPGNVILTGVTWRLTPPRVHASFLYVKSMITIAMRRAMRVRCKCI